MPFETRAYLTHLSHTSKLLCALEKRTTKLTKQGEDPVFILADVWVSLFPERRVYMVPPCPPCTSHLNVTSSAKPSPALWGGQVPLGSPPTAACDPPRGPFRGFAAALLLLASCWLPWSPPSQGVGPVLPAGLLPVGHQTVSLGGRQEGKVQLKAGDHWLPRGPCSSSNFVMSPSQFSVSHDHSTMTVSRRPSGIHCNLCSLRAAILKRLQRTLK